MEFTILGRQVRIYECGKIEVLRKKGWYSIKPYLSSHGYHKINLNKKQLSISRLVAFAYLGLDLENPKIHIDHIDRVRTNNHISNLRLVTNQQNSFNKSKINGHDIKGFKVINGRFRAQINFNQKQIYLGTYDTEEEAHQAYLTAKATYHRI